MSTKVPVARGTARGAGDVSFDATASAHMVREQQLPTRTRTTTIQHLGATAPTMYSCTTVPERYLTEYVHLPMDEYSVGVEEVKDNPYDALLSEGRSPPVSSHCSERLAVSETDPIGHGPRSVGRCFGYGAARRNTRQTGRRRPARRRRSACDQAGLCQYRAPRCLISTVSTEHQGAIVCVRQAESDRMLTLDDVSSAFDLQDSDRRVC